MPPPPHRFSRIVGGLRIGPDFFDRAGLSVDAPPPRGIVARLDDLAPQGASLDGLSPAVRAFFEDPGALLLRVRPRWRPWAGAAWRVLRGLFVAMGQLCVPLREAVVRARTVALDGAREGRPDARGVVRSFDDTGAVFQVFAYGVTATPSGPRMSVAIPLPLGHLAGLLRLTRDGDAVTLSTRGPDAGVWFVTPLGSLRVPLDETLRLWPATPADDGAWPGATLRGHHAQSLFDRVAVEYDYAFRPVSPPRDQVTAP